MFISHKYKAIFVHIQRTGGNSIQKIFEEFDPDLIETVPVDPSKNRTKHCYISDIKAAVDEAVFERYVKFCVVRNPFDRMVSWYSHFKDRGNDEDARIRLNQGDRALRMYYRGLKILGRNSELSAAYTKLWLRFSRMFKRFEPGSAEEVAIRFAAIGERVMSEVNKNASSFEEFVMLPRDYPGGIFERFYIDQAEYASHDGRLAMDRILKVESLSQDFEALAEQIGFEGRLPHVNRSSRKARYQEYYNEKTRAIVAERFRRDCEYFGYSF
ncbi:uncharacterized protein SOCE26_049760 [Sorangium cellulosum]|uniref:Sulfotransferase family protein n=1 Tax=Sorangium cellulosum TaxID=56 RepID=A0A2L0EW43_SORCE|nr:sulfotransferase family 2 domain-containing protein [Sorangium cellulosum]AUX43527.1 uncharacterized protein SOCE26_049760 [Sorangium cellulosum]